MYFNRKRVIHLEAKDQRSDADRLKEMFEYEMTGVLLGFQNEVRQNSEELFRPYQEMEIPDAHVSYQDQTPELEKIVMSEHLFGEMRDLTEVTLDAEAPEIQLHCKMPGEVHPDAKKAELDIRVESVTLPEQTGKTLQFEQPQLLADRNAVRERLADDALSVQPFEPQEKITVQMDAVTIPGSAPMRPRRIRNVLTHSNADALRMKLPKTDVKPNFSKPSDMNGKVEVHIKKVPQKKFSAAVGTQIRLTRPAPVPDVKRFHFEGISENTVEPRVKAKIPAKLQLHLQSGKALVPDRSAFPVLKEPHAPVAAPMVKPSVEISGISEKIELPGFGESFRKPELVIRNIETKYAEVPEKPDFSSVYKSIMDTVKAEL